MKNNRGFTLVELICALAIIAVIMLLAIPSYNIITDMSFRADARNLVNDTRNIKDLTVIEAVEYKIIFTKDGYRIIDDSSNLVKEYIFTRGCFLEDYELNQGKKKVNFMGYNLAGNGVASGSLIISNRNKSLKKKITIVPVTGRILINDI